jgi:hypothetical protein
VNRCNELLPRTSHSASASIAIGAAYLSVGVRLSMPYSTLLRIVGFWSVVGLTVPLLGCSMHPLPGDIPRVPTFDIVERIRCEAQEGLRSFPQNDPLIKNIVEGTTIGFDFNFTITEINDAGAGSPGHLIFQKQGNGANNFTLDLSGQVHKQRDNTRRFRIIEDLKTLNSANCSREATRANWVYPITGATGLGEVVHTFIKLETLGNLQWDSPGGGLSSQMNHIVFSDVLHFNTVLDVTAAPTLTLTPVVGRFMVTNANIVGEAKRTDDNTVIVALARDNVKIVRGVPKRILSPKLAAARVTSQDLVEKGVVRDSREVRTLVQKDAEAYTRVLIELQRLRDLEDDDREAPRLLGEKILKILRTP